MPGDLRCDQRLESVVETNNPSVKFRFGQVVKLCAAVLFLSGDTHAHRDGSDQTHRDQGSTQTSQPGFLPFDFSPMVVTGLAVGVDLGPMVIPRNNCRPRAN